MIKTISKVDIQPGQRVLIRGSLNVSLGEQGVIVDDFRLRRTLATLDLVIAASGIPILLSHIDNDQGSTMTPVVAWFNDCGYSTELVADYYPYKDGIKFEAGKVYIFENIRDYPGAKANDLDFAADIAKYGDMYVNESFDSAHRAHATTATLPTLLPSYAGLNFAAEITELGKVFTPKRPFSFIIGGAKLETKLPLIIKLLDLADRVYVAGALANPLLAAKGVNVGKSLMPDETLDVSAIITHPNLELPIDFINQNHQVITTDQTDNESALLDIGPDSTRSIEMLIQESQLVVWNGPLGNFEGGFADATNIIAKNLANSDTYSIIGGGDTLAAFDDKLEKKIDWVSTGGGAMLDFIESNGDLPAIKALK